MKKLLAILLGILTFLCTFASCTENQGMDDPQQSTINIPQDAIYISNVELLRDENRYFITPEDNMYENVTAFRDSDYYYYMVPVGVLTNVPLEESATSYKYDGSGYTIELTSAIASTSSIENMIEKAEKECLSIGASLTVSNSLSAGVDGFEASRSFEAAITGNKEWENTSTESITNAHEYSEETSRSVTIVFDESKQPGYYRWILVGEIQVYAVVIYDIAAESYNTYTYSVILGQSYALDYSTSMSFSNDIDVNKLKYDIDEDYFDKLSKPDNWIDEEKEIGDGSATSPYLITSAAEFSQMNATDDTLHYKLMHDIDFSGQELTAFSDFRAVLDGNGFRVYNFTINASGDNAGIFCKNSGTIKNLIVGHPEYDTTIEKSKNNGKLYVGAIAGENNGTIKNCKVENVTISGTVKRTSNGRIYSNVGGVAGKNTATIQNCTVSFSTINAYANHSSQDYQNSVAIVGGIVGEHYGRLINCYSKQNEITSYASTRSNMLDDADAYSISGGLVGKNYADGSIEKCLGDHNIVTSDGKVSTNMGKMPTLYKYCGLLVGERESGSIYDNVINYSESSTALVNKGEDSACSTIESLEDLPFSINSIGYQKQ